MQLNMSVHSSDSSSIISKTTTDETTTFVDAGDVHELRMGHAVGTGVPTTSTDISRFMEKPYLFASGTLGIGSVVNSLLLTASVGTTLIGNPQWVNKMYGFNLVRGTAVVKIVVNANPFQAGRMLLHFLPGNLNTTKVAMHNATVASKTTQPGVELDLRQSSVTMKVPYVGPKNYYTLSSQTSSDVMDWGTFYLTVLSPLATGSGGDTSVSWTAYMWFEDFELATPIVPQSSASAKVRGKSLLSVEADSVSNMRSTSMANMAGAVSMAAGTLSTIPILSSIMGPLSWASGVASGVFTYLGWSRPLLLEKPIITNLLRYSGVSDAIDSAVPLSIRSDNQISIIDCCSGRAEDEMSFNFLKQVPSLINSFEFNESQIANDILYTNTIRPSTLYSLSNKTVGAFTATYETGPPIWALSKVFSLYRGSIVLRLSFVKTDYHCGRLQVTFTPSDALVCVEPTLSTGALAMRTIIDLREFSDIEIEFPYLLDSSYVTPDTPIGTLTIRVLNQLKAPETASNSVVALMYFRGGDDFEFQAPYNSEDLSFTPTVFSPQADVDYSLLKTASGNLKGKPLSVAFSEMSVGEHFTSVKQLVSRYSPVVFSQTSYQVGSGDILYYWPFHNSVASMTPVTGVFTVGDFGPDTISFFSQWYAFYRGAINVMPSCNNSFWASVSTQPNSTSILQRSNDKGYLFGSTGVGNPAWAPSRLGFYNGVNVASSGTVAAYRVPYYCRTHCSQVVSSVTSGRSSALLDSNPISTLSLATTTVTSADGGFIQALARSTADDFQFSYFMGTVPILVAYA